MIVKILYVGLLAWLASVGGSAILYAAPSEPTAPDQTQEELHRLKEDYDQILREWRQSGQQHLPSLQSPLVRPDSLSGSIPPECALHLQAEKAKLKRGGYSKEAWLHHVFDCELCCAPLLHEIMNIHLLYATASPHVVVLFDFDTSTLQETYQHRLDDLMRDFDPRRDQLLLIGRASKIGTRGYNITLSGKRAGEIKDYVMSKFAVDEDRIRHLYFGYDPPQLTLANAARYGITADDMAAIDTQMENSATNKINQSVVVILNQNASDVHPPQRPPPSATLGPQHESQRPADVLTLVTGSATSPSFHLGREMAKWARHGGLDVVVQESKNAMDAVHRLRHAETPAVGIVPSDVLAFLKGSPDAEMHRLGEALRLLVPLYHEEVHLLARQDIQRVEELAGKRVIVGQPGSGTWLTAHHILRRLQVQPAERIDHLSSVEAIAAVLRGTADALFYLGTKPAQPLMRIRNLLADPQYAPLVQEVHFVPLTPENGLQDYGASSLGPADYAWLTQRVPTLTVTAVLARLGGSRHRPPQDPRRCHQLAVLGQVVRDHLTAVQPTGHRPWPDVNLRQQLAFWEGDPCVGSD